MRNRLPSIRLLPQVSKQLLRLLVLLHLMAAAVILSMPLLLGLRIVLLLTLLLHAIRLHRRFYPFSAGHIAGALIEDDGYALVRWGSGRESKARLRADSLVTPWIIVLRFDLSDRRLPATLLVCRDAVTQTEFRLLRVLLKFVLLDTDPDQ
jgi:hypothetical protein